MASISAFQLSGKWKKAVVVSHRQAGLGTIRGAPKKRGIWKETAPNKPSARTSFKQTMVRNGNEAVPLMVRCALLVAVTTLKL